MVSELLADEDADLLAEVEALAEDLSQRWVPAEEVDAEYAQRSTKSSALPMPKDPCGT